MNGKTAGDHDGSGHPLRYHRAVEPPPNDLFVGAVGERRVMQRQERDHVTVDSKHLADAVKRMRQEELPIAGAVTVVTIDLGFNCGLCEVVRTTADQKCLWMPRMLRQGASKKRKDGGPHRTRWVKGVVKPPTGLVSMVLLAPWDTAGDVVILSAYYGPKTARENDDPHATEEDKRFWRGPDGTGHAFVLPIDIDQCYEELPLE